MSKVNAKGQLSGAVGPVYFRVLNGQGIVQAKPGRGKVKQAQATKRNASDFGVASSTAKKIRLAVGSLLKLQTDPMHYRRLTAKVHEAMLTGNDSPKGSRTLAGGTPKVLEGFQWNDRVNFGKSCLLAPVISLATSNRITVDIANTAVREALAMPRLAAMGELFYVVVVLDTAQWSAQSVDIFKIPVAATATSLPAQQFMTEPIPQGSLVLVIAALQYFSAHSAMGAAPLETKTGFPAEISGEKTI